MSMLRSICLVNQWLFYRHVINVQFKLSGRQRNVQRKKDGVATGSWSQILTTDNGIHSKEFVGSVKLVILVFWKNKLFFNLYFV